MHRTASPMAILPLATKRARRRPFNGPSSLPLETRCSTQTQKLRFSLRKPRGFIKSSSAVDAERPGHSELLHAAYAVVLSPATRHRRVQKAIPFSAAHFPGHCFRLIPASCSFATSAFPVPPQHHWVPSDKATARFGNRSPRPWCRRKMGQKKEAFSCPTPMGTIKSFLIG